MTGGELNATQIHARLQELGRRLLCRGVHGDVKLIGGAALISQGIGNRPTADIDASYADNAAVNAVVTEMAAAYDLAPDWLNADDAVDLAYNKYGNHAIPLAAGRDNYLIVVDDALDAATTLEPND